MRPLAELLTLEQSLGDVRVLSVYGANDAADPADRSDWRTSVGQAITAVRDGAHAASHAEREALEAAIRLVKERLEQIPIERRFPGWVAFATHDRVLYADQLPVSVPILATWGDRLCVAPYAAARSREDRAVVAVADSRAADIYVLSHGALDAPVRVEAAPHGTPAPHMGNPPSPGFHAGTRGATGTDAAERARLIARADLIRHIVERLETYAAPDDWMLVGGIPEVASAILSQLPPTLQRRARTLPGLDMHASAADVAARAQEAAQRLRNERDLALVQELLERQAADGLARVGAAATFAALRVGAVAQLVVSRALLWQASPAAEEAIRSAQRSDAGIVCVTDEAATQLERAAEGIAARLRYQPSPWVPVEGIALESR